MLGQSTSISYHTEANGYIFFAMGVTMFIRIFIVHEPIDFASALQVDVSQGIVSFTWRFTDKVRVAKTGICRPGYSARVFPVQGKK